jgi:hypothetical protein
MTDKFLELRASIINRFILDSSKTIIQQLSLYLKKDNKISEHLKVDIDNLPKKKRIKIVFIIAYTLLFNAQRFFWENIIQNEKYGLKFESFLYKEFAEISGADPTPYINDYLKYIKNIGDSGEIQYVGSKICEEINIKDAFLIMDIVNIYSSFLINNFYQELKEIWDMSDKEIEKKLR